MQDKYINATKLIERLKCEKEEKSRKRREIRFQPVTRRKSEYRKSMTALCLFWKGTGSKCGSAPCSKVADMPELR